MTAVRLSIEPSNIGAKFTDYRLECPHWQVQQVVANDHGSFFVKRGLTELRELWDRDGCRLCDATAALSTLDRAITGAEEAER